MILQKQYNTSSVSSTNIGKWFSDLKDFDKGQSVFEQIIKEYSKTEAAQAFYFLGFEYKRRKQMLLAYEAFEQSLINLTDIFQIQAYEELAKIAEHVKKDYIAAKVHVEEAVLLIRKTKHLKPIQMERKNLAFEKRLKRIVNKQTISRASADFDRK